MSDNGDKILAATRQHVELTVIALVLGLLISFPLALAARRWRRTTGPILGLTGALFTIPSLALFALLVPFTGLSRTTAEIGLVSYTLLILVRNIVAGLDGVPADVREAAHGMGYRPAGQLLRVELPLALPVIVAGIRIATVTTIGLVTVTGLIGQGGLGALIIEGINRDFRSPLV
ncbi:MAG: ABC transporter permease, partial [Acidimicrobiales bacterium]